LTCKFIDGNWELSSCTEEDTDVFVKTFCEDSATMSYKCNNCIINHRRKDPDCCNDKIIKIVAGKVMLVFDEEIYEMV